MLLRVVPTSCPLFIDTAFLMLELDLCDELVAATDPLPSGRPR
jgi:hypothetical protein